MSEHLLEGNESEKQTYQLIGLSEHIGYTNKAGHYTAHAKRNGLWYEFNDE
jgi:ubiquitin C-terminal hydrolase